MKLIKIKDRPYQRKYNSTAWHIVKEEKENYYITHCGKQISLEDIEKEIETSSYWNPLHEIGYGLCSFCMGKFITGTEDYRRRVQLDGLQDILGNLIDRSLTGREAEIMKLRLGLNGPPQGLAEIAKQYKGVTRERVRLIIAKTMRKLRNIRL